MPFDWSVLLDFGLGGLALALFAWIIKYLLETIKHITDKHEESQDKRDEKMRNSFDSLEKAIMMQNNRSRSND